jgi:uncharacterized protein YcnI
VETTQAQCPRRPGWAARSAIAGAGVLALLGVAAPAAADVSVTPTEATQGDTANLTFRITNESPTASITEVDVQLPADTPIAEVYPLSVDDWAPAMTNTKIDKPVESLHGYQITDVTTAVKWIAMPDKALPPGGKTELYLSIGPLPATAQLSFAVVLSNSDGTQVRWTAQSGANAAPVLVLKSGPVGQGGHAAAHGGATTPDAAAADGETGDSGSAGGTSYAAWSLVTLLFIAAICVISIVAQRRRTAGADPEEPKHAEETKAAEPSENQSMATTP